MKNFTVTTPKNIKIDKKIVHTIVSELKNILEFTVESLNVNFVTPEIMIGINKQYLAHDYDTDVIAFNYSGDNSKLDGEIFISIGQTIDNSIRFNVNLDSELIRLIVHGILHLLGYDDKKPYDKKKMKIEEDKLTEKLKKDYKNILIEYDY
ncbi:Metal-dependent hydrolase YbeY, involved in rRNA and/or ribosome maturation and assembly [hydrothermal vent metagenome]|uniref:Metal-dependent hydrolase YbeY, involved in rRNA and/or ribosome maturation and assembly n=1 Tax=hydrothermal vent metagenome TaxID=652676 RepID=A0A3B1C488_9ZZZZ